MQKNSSFVFFKDELDSDEEKAEKIMEEVKRKVEKINEFNEALKNVGNNKSDILKQRLKLK